MGPINNIPALVQIMAWCRPGDKPLSEQCWLVCWRIYASLGLNELIAALYALYRILTDCTVERRNFSSHNDKRAHNLLSKIILLVYKFMFLVSGLIIKGLHTEKSTQYYSLNYGKKVEVLTLCRNCRRCYVSEYKISRMAHSCALGQNGVS